VDAPVMSTTLPLRSEIMSIPSRESRQRIAKGAARSLEAYLNWLDFNKA
jgi:hypothetical protein